MAMLVNQRRALIADMTGARELWYVCGWYSGNGNPECMLGTRIRESPTPKYGIMHMKLAGISVVVFLANHDFPRHVYFANGNQDYLHL